MDLSQIDTPSAHEMNAVGQRFGLTGNDFFSFLTNDVEEQEAMKLARQQEEEKAMFSVSICNPSDICDYCLAKAL